MLIAYSVEFNAHMKRFQFTFYAFFTLSDLFLMNKNKKIYHKNVFFYGKKGENKSKQMVGNVNRT